MTNDEYPGGWEIQDDPPVTTNDSEAIRAAVELGYEVEPITPKAKEAANRD